MLEKDGSSRVLVEPDKLGPEGSHASIDNYAASPDAKRVAYNLAVGGGEITSVHVIDVATGKETGDVVDCIWGECAVSWLPDGQAFFYTQMADAAPGVDPMLNMRVRLHRLGKPSKDDPNRPRRRRRRELAAHAARVPRARRLVRRRMDGRLRRRRAPRVARRCRVD